MTYTQWLANVYPAYPPSLLAFYRNLERSDFYCNRAAPNPFWTNHLFYQMPGAMHLDLAYNSWPYQPDATARPSFLENDSGHLPNPTVLFLSSFGFPMHSWLWDCWLGLEEPSELRIKPRRSYWTGKPRHRRNLS